MTRQRPRSGPGRTPTGELCSGCRVKGSWNVVALTEYGDDGVGVDGRVAERYAYTPYAAKNSADIQITNLKIGLTRLGQIRHNDLDTYRSIDACIGQWFEANPAY